MKQLLYRSIPLVLGLIFFQLNAQELSKSEKEKFDESIKAADFYFAKQEYALVSIYLENAHDLKDRKDPVILERLARTHWLAKDYHTASRYYQQLVLKHEKNFPEAKLMYAKTLIAQARYVEAKKILIDFQVQHKRDDEIMEEAERAISSCKFGVESMQNQTRVHMENIGFVFNSKYSETQINFEDPNNVIYNTEVKSLRKDKKTLKLKSIGKKGSDTVLVKEIYEAILTDSVWSTKKYVYFPILKGHSVQGTPYLARSNTLLYVTLRNDETNTHAIYRTEKVAGAWSKLKILGKEINTKDYSSKDVMVVPKGDEEIIFYSSNKPEGEGGYDIYFALIDWEGNVSDGGILKGEINTQFDELTPYFDKDENHLYFSSDGKKGLGGMDIYRSIGDVYGGWSRSENLGYPVNSSMDDIGYVYKKSRDKGYLSSNRVGGLNESTSYFDLYTLNYNFEDQAIDFDVTLRLFDRKDKFRLTGVSVEVYPKGSDEALLSKTTNTGEDLNFKLSNKSDYFIKIRQQGYLAMDLNVSVKRMTVISSSEKLTYFFFNDEKSDIINALQTNVYMTKTGGPVQTFVNKPAKKVEPEKVEEIVEAPKPKSISIPKPNLSLTEEEAFKKISTEHPRDLITGLFFHVQVGAFRKPRAEEEIYAHLISFGGVGEEQHDGWYKYLLGGKKHMEAAKDFQVEIINKGIKDAFIVPYYHGERLNMRQAYELFKKQ